MESSPESAEFTFSWLALKLLGRGLYSNPWSALSELVANGLDAKASQVLVYVDAVDKSDATIEVIDNGTGMSREDIDTYVKVGYNKREAAAKSGTVDPSTLRGRKGIGKLAALFLSPHFFVSTKTESDRSEWELDSREDRFRDDENPRLVRATELPETPNDEMWRELRTGTRLTLRSVDLTGYGPKSMDALGSRLANQFILEGRNSPSIMLWLREAPTETPAYYRVEKRIAYRNFAELAQYFPDPTMQPGELADRPTVVRIPARGLPGDVYEHTPTRSALTMDPAEDEAWEEIKDLVDSSNRTYDGHRYELTGWIGVHATIDVRTARENDERFTKNKYYNPAQLRVYVRGKLATEHLLSQLGLTGTYTNYIEGEISFDLLDDDHLPDIATSNRQDFDETDKRVTLLRALVRPVVRRLIQKRNALASKINAEITAEKARTSAAGKQQFSDQLGLDLAQHPEIPQHVRDDLHTVITNKLKGEIDVEAKTTYRVFISHARADRAFASFIDEVLRAKGATPDEVFYTSRTGSTDQLEDTRALSEIIKESITDSNTMLFYMTSGNFMKSEFCLFEGGAGWATRAVSEYLKLNMDYETIPKFLTNGRSEVCLIDGDKIELRPEVHNYLIRCVFNPMIIHLNRGREIGRRSLMPLFDVPNIPAAIELARSGESERKYYDSVIEEFWRLLVERQTHDYLRDYKPRAN